MPGIVFDYRSALITSIVAISMGLAAGTAIADNSTSTVSPASASEMFYVDGDLDGAAAAVSEFTGIDALIPHTVGDEAIVAFRGRRLPSAAIATVEVFVQGSGGGYLLTQTSDGIEPRADWEHMGSAGQREVWKSEADDGWREYYVLDPAFPDIVIVLSKYSSRTDDEALAIVGVTRQ